MYTKFALLILMAIVVGCSQTEQPNAASSDSPDKVAIGPEEKTPTATPHDQSQPHAIDESLLTVDTSPEVICQAFIDFLRLGENSKAEKLLSQDSIAQTRKHKLDLATPAGKDAKYAIGQPSFATNQQKVAFVPVHVDAAGPETSADQSFSMMLKRGIYGWKITGIMLQTASENQDLYSFENPLDVLKIKSMIDGEVRQARLPVAGDQNHYQ